MKNLIILFLAVALAFSCNTDKCEDVVCTVGTCEDGICVDPCDSIDCGIGGTCSTGLCLCDAGYGQDSAGACNIELRANFIGNYSMTESCTDASDGTVYTVNHTVAITNATSVASMLVSGLGVDNAGTLFTATPSATTFTINDTQVSVDDGSGGSILFDAKNISATLTGVTLTINYDLYSVSSGALLYTCVDTGDKL
ncbi:MAG: Unknown protein [uncultured Aureispira sp.]|uniref:EGF-like domain-containing protein n=1 Tax=uncultured Aureispira sp. TaxID=1331704 RepID=A0A6S6TRC1_9BACT|nr:MAG: Unknown protein [uncultured Aureispira sp.]